MSLSDEAHMSGEDPVAADLLAAMGGRERFVASFSARTFSPERLADRALTDAASLWSAGSRALTEAGGTHEMLTEWQARFKRLWIAYQHAGARTMNWMITGPARFPVDRNRKRMDVEQKRGYEFYAHANGAVEFVRRRQRSAEKAELSAQAATVEHAETAFPGGRLVRNVTLDRVQLVFDGRPDAETISQLKSRAFRWSPREGAWQRQLTLNGLRAAQAVVATLAKASEPAQ